MILDWSYNYHAYNMCQQVAPIEIYVKNKQTNKNLFAVNKHRERERERERERV